MPLQTMSRTSDGTVPLFSSSLKIEHVLTRLPELAEPAEDSHSTSSGPAVAPSVAEFAPVRPDVQFSHKSQNSVSTLESDMTDRSPSATMSPTASSVTSDVTPGTSPDTPASSQSTSFLALRSLSDSQKPAIAGGESDLSRPAPPPKKARNLKNLAVNTSNSVNIGRKAVTASLVDTTHDNLLQRTIISPSFVKPHPTPKRWPTNLGLTLKTPATGTFASQQMPHIIPPTPTIIRPVALRHHQSSPSLPTYAALRTPEKSIRSPNHPLRRPMAMNMGDVPSEQDEAELIPQHQMFEESESRASSPNAYPDGPICIYEPFIFLGPEPNANLASDYGVVINVASEVKSPFPQNDFQNISSIAQSPTDGTSINPGSIKMPKETRLPIYRHILWEHNTDIVPDLLDLVKEIEGYEQESRKVLVHCQLGVSRSASLMVAYGLYKNPTQTVQQAYDAVKQRSKWISPNMNLIMQLQEFRTELLKKPQLGSKQYSYQDSPASGIALKDSSAPRSAPLNGKLDDSAGPVPPAPISPGPSSAPSAFSRLFGGDQPRFSRSNYDLRAANHSAELELTSKRPKTSAALLDRIQTSPLLLLPSLPQISPFPRAIFPISPSDDSIISPRSAEFAMTPVQPQTDDDMFGLSSPRVTSFTAELPHRHLHGDTAPEIRALAQGDLQRSPRRTGSSSPVSPVSMQKASAASYDTQTATEFPPLPGRTQFILPGEAGDRSSLLMSPRAVEFTSNPFEEMLASQPPPRVPTPQASVVDPRSPAVQGSSAIFRSIFDVL